MKKLEVGIICVKVTLTTATPKEVNTPIGRKKCMLSLFECRKIGCFSQVFKILLFSKVPYIGHVPMFYVEI